MEVLLYYSEKSDTTQFWLCILSFGALGALHMGVESAYTSGLSAERLVLFYLYSVSSTNFFLKSSGLRLATQVEVEGVEFKSFWLTDVAFNITHQWKYSVRISQGVFFLLEKKDSPYEDFKLMI